MKKRIVQFAGMLSLLFFCVSASGQVNRFERGGASYKSQNTIATSYLGVGTGINNYSGLLGLEWEIPILPRLSIVGTLGLGGWGYKAGGSLQYYLREPQFGGALCLGFSNAFGGADVPLTLQDGTEAVFDLRNAGTVNIAYLYNFRLGKRSKFVLGGGWAIPTSTTPYTVTSPPGYTLSSTDREVMKVLQPGGLLLCVKFIFALR